jgi:DNA gyrase subunit B
LEDHRGPEPKREVFQEKGGVAAFALNLAEGSKFSYEPPILISGVSDEIEVEVGFIHTGS